MVNFLTVAVALLLVTSCLAEVPRANRRFRNRSRFFARQELSEEVPAQTPYPPAGEKPDVEFDLPSDESAVFGDKNVVGAPDQTYGPPETEVEPVEAQEDFGIEPESERFTAVRGNKKLNQKVRLNKSAALRKPAPLKTSAPAQLQQQPLQQQILAQPIQLADGRIIYSIYV